MDSIVCTIGGKPYTYRTDISADNAVRCSFDRLATETFGLSFESWHQEGYWGDGYIPHVLMANGEVVANVSVNVMDVVWRGQPEKYLQIGTVMTRPDYRNKGLSRWLMERVMEAWEGRYDAMCLYANDSVLDFYPRFGFAGAPEFQYRTSALKPAKGVVRKLDMQADADRKLLLDRYKLSNPFSAFSVTDNRGFLMFYCTLFLADCVYYLPEYDMAVIAGYDGPSLTCYDIYGAAGPLLNEVLQVLMKDHTTELLLGFTPSEPSGFEVFPLKQEDTTLFVLQAGENRFASDKLMLPLLFHG